MKKGVVKVLCVVLSLMVLAVFAAGCGGTKEAPAGTEAPAVTEAAGSEAPAATEAAAPAEKVNLTYSYWGNADEQKAVDETLAKFNGSQDKIVVKGLVIPWEQYATKLNTMAVAGELPDMGNQIERLIIRWAAEGMLADTSSMFGPGEAKPLENLAYKYQGKTVAYASANEVLLLYYNKDMFDKAGVAYPPSSADQAWTWDQFVDAAKKLTLDKNGKTPNDKGFDAQNIKQYGCLVENLPWQLEAWAYSNGDGKHGFFSQDGTKCAINEPGTMEAIQKIADLHLKDHVAPLSTGATDDSIQRSIISRTCAMGTGGQWNIGTCLGTAKKEGLNYGVAVLPYMKNKATLCTAGSTVIFNQTKHLQEAFEYVKWSALEENSWSLIEQGITMPRLDKWYKDETLLHKWIDNPNFPPFDQYKSAVVDYAMDSNITHPAAWFNVDNFADFEALLQSILGDVWTGKTTVEKAITANYDKLDAAFKGQGK
jgi:multiple sugar transport system substrate-binding protein